MKQAIYSIQDRRNEALIASVWSGDTNLYLSWTMDSQDAARWCKDCYQEFFDNLPDNIQEHCMPVVNKPFADGWEYLCRECGQEAEVVS